MKILFIANRVPYPPFRGDKLKIYNLASELSKKHELHLLTIAENKTDVDSVNILLKPIEGKHGLLFQSINWVYRPKWKSAISALWGIFSKRPLQVAFFRSSSFENKLKKVLKENQFDVIHVQHIRMAQYFEDLNCQNVILDLPDAFSLYWKRRIEKSTNIFSKLLSNIEFKRLFKYEMEVIPRFNKVLVCSKEDQEYLIKNTGFDVELLQNGVNTTVFQPRNQSFTRNRVLFTGNMDYAPNVDAVVYFVNEIWPHILSEIPNAVFIIAGQRPVAKVLALASESVKITGFIPDLADEYSKAHVVVSPLRIGAGTQNKVLEALSMDIPVVSTNVGYAGLELLPDEGIALSLNNKEIIANTIKILRDEDYRNDLGRKGGAKIRNKFSWQGIANKLETYFLEVLHFNQNH